MAFRIEAFQNRHLAPGAARVDAILAVSADPAVAAARELMIGFIIDKSGSMANGRIEAASRAVAKAIEMLADGTWFFVVAFDGNAYTILPETKASAASKGWAAGQIAQLTASGGTAMSRGLAAARAIFARRPGAIRRAVFLTDGRNEGEKASVTLAELARCEGVFECDCWGVGTDWQVGEVQAMASALLGKASLVPEASGVEAAFRASIDKAAGKVWKDVRLRLWAPAGARIALLKQVSPTLADLGARARLIAPQVHEIATGSWSAGEARDFHLAVELRAGAVGDEVLACRPSVAYLAPAAGGWVEVEDKAPDARVLATWTKDAALSDPIDDHVAHYAGQDELRAAIDEGLAAREAGREDRAVDRLGRAVELAHRSANAAMTQRLARVVDVIDPRRGTVRLKREVQPAAAMDLALESATTQRLPRRPSARK